MTLEDKVKFLIGEQTLTILSLQLQIEELLKQKDKNVS